jgi:O-antigen/teichoic acid export membrane protein
MFANFFAMLFVIISNYELLTLKISKNKLKKAIIFGIPEVPKLMVGLLYSTFDRTMLASYKGVSEIGYYEFGSRFAGIVKIFNDAIGKSFSPYFQESIHQSNHQSNMNILDSFYKIIFSLGFIGIGISYFSEEALLVLTTEEFHVAKYLVPFLVSYYLFGSLNQLASNQFIASEKLYYMAPISLIGLIINIILNIILIPLLGALGAVISTAVVGFITTIILFFYGNKALKLPISNYKILMIYALIFSFLILGYPVLYLELSFILKVLFKSLLLVLFLIIGFHLRFYNLADIYYLKNIFFNTFKE